MQTEDKYSHIFEYLNISPIMHSLVKSSHLGRPDDLNYRAMIYSLLIAKMERMEFVKDIVRRLRSSLEFRNQCRFTGSDRIPSESSYSRFIKTLEDKGILEKIQDSLVSDALMEGFISGEQLAMDSSPVEAWDCQYAESAAKRRAQRRKVKSDKSVEQQQLDIEAPQETPSSESNSKSKPVYWRGRTTKEEAERRRKEREAYEETLTPFERSVAKMLSYSYEDLMEVMPRQPALCAKKNSKGRMTSWYGYKANVLIDTDSQYILNGVMCSANLNDQRPAVVLLKGLRHKFPELQVQHVLADKGYDCVALYQLVRDLKAYPIIDLIHHTNPPEGFDEYFRPLCQQGHAYVYDSFDSKYETLKYTSPKECRTCPLAEHGCQKVYKIQMKQDIRKYSFPARGSNSFMELYKKRTAVERVFAYLKEYFGLHRTRHRGTRANVDFQLSTLAYNLSKFALDSLNKRISKEVDAA